MFDANSTDFRCIWLGEGAGTVRGATPLRPAVFARRQRAPHALGVEVGRIDWSAGLLPL
jgi:hypothetical protein